MTKPTKIENKVSLKFYGDQELQHKIVKLLEDNGFNGYGRIDQGNEYTTQKAQQGWAASMTFFGPAKSNSKWSGETTSRIVKAAVGSE